MNYYARAIEIFDTIETDEQKHALLFEILKTNPGAIVKAGGKMETSIKLSTLTPFERQIRILGKAKKIQAIKDLRAETGLGLKEAKERVECLVAL